jgi:hypothetical protein
LLTLNRQPKNRRTLATDSGSAVVEFVLILLPFLFLATAQLNWLADVSERAELRAVAVEAARFGALADVTAEEAAGALRLRVAAFTGASASISLGPMVSVTIGFPSHQWFGWAASRIEVHGLAKAELQN